MAIQFDNTNTGTVTLKPPASGSVALVLPSADGTSGQLISTDGSGNLSFITAGALPSQTGNSGKYLTTDGTDASWATLGAFPSGTAMLFAQTSAPTGWTKSTAHDNKALRLVSGTAGSGGSAAFTTAFGTPTVTGSLSGSVGATTLSTAQLASHTHSVATYIQNSDAGVSNGVTRVNRKSQLSNVSNAANATGSNSSHTHSFSGSLSSASATIDVQYVDVIIATKD